MHWIGGQFCVCMFLHSRAKYLNMFQNVSGFPLQDLKEFWCLIFCLWIPQTVLDSANTVADSASSPIFGAILIRTVFKVFVCGIPNSKEDQRTSNFADSATNLIKACCGICLQCTECTVLPRNAVFQIIFWKPKSRSKRLCYVTTFS